MQGGVRNWRFPTEIPVYVENGSTLCHNVSVEQYFNLSVNLWYYRSSNSATDCYKKERQIYQDAWVSARIARVTTISSRELAASI